MLNIITKKFTNKAKKADVLLKPIQQDLAQLEINLLKSLASGNNELDKMVKYVFNSGGKRLRPALVILLIKALNNGEVRPNHYELAEAVEMIHTASLLHDDVIDEAETRRGFLTIGKKWGTKSAIIAGDYILSKALTKLVNIGNIAVEMFAGTLNELCIGEIMQKASKYKVISLEEYINKSERKTAKLFMAAMETAASISPNTNNLIIKAARSYSQNYGIAFQITDDILNFFKNGASDLRDGIITAPVLFAIEEYEQKGDKSLKKLIENGLKTDKDFKQALKLVLASGGMHKARNLAVEYAEKAVQSIEIIENNSYKQILSELAYQTAERDV